MGRQICWRTRIGMAVLAAACLSLGSVTAQRSSASLLHVMKPAAYIVSQGHSGVSACTDHVCYTPAVIKQAYDFPPNLDGSGQTIVVVVAYGSPTIGDDLAQFDSTFGIPSPPSFNIVTGTGAGGVGSGATFGWAVETSAEVEYAHAMAPGAAIVLVVSPTDDANDVLATEQQLLPQYPGAIVSQSFGDDETDPSAQSVFADLHVLYASLAANGETLLASAGDFGASDGGPQPVAAFPASDPLVTGVGGTEGDPYPGGLVRDHGRYGNEQVWNESDSFGAATGGAPSVLFPAPSYQAGLTGNAARTVPDVSYDAAINGGVQVYFSGLGGFITFGGTSAGVPQWAGILALADQARASAGKGPLAAANAALYAVAQNDHSYRHDFHDIVKGNNSLAGLPGFSAGPGYDLATGLGTPDVARLVNDLTTASTPPAPKPTDVTCTNQQLTGTYHDVTVSKGAWCDLSGATVLHDVHASQASGLGITNSSIAHDVSADHVSGTGDPSHAGANVICGSTIAHDLNVHDSGPATPWAIGGTGCANGIGHDLNFANNSPGGDLSANTVAHDLNCEGNGSVTDASGTNSVGHDASGQCAALAGSLAQSQLKTS
jgi:subtilase family serine protease